MGDGLNEEVRDAGDLVDVVLDAAAEIEQLRAALKAERSGRPWYYLAGDPETSGGDLAEVLDAMDSLVNEVVNIGISREAGQLWGVRLVMTWCDDDTPNVTIVKAFDTEAEALAAVASHQPPVHEPQTEEPASDR